MLDGVREKEEQMAMQRAQMLGLHYFDTSKLTQLPQFEGLLSNPEMYQEHAVVVSQQEGSLVIGITSRTPQPSLDKLRQKFPDFRTSFALISESGHRDFMKLYDPPEEIEYQDVALTADSSNQTLNQMSQTIEKVLSDDLFDYLLRQAIKLGASDIHLENSRDGAIGIRFRVDGVMHTIATLVQEKYRQLMSTIASKADISSSSPQPQTGHISYGIDGNEVNIRIETVPTLYGQDAVLRIFTITEDLMNLDNLGLSSEEQKLINEIIEHPTGLVLSVGPTGSGKTTTLYSIINRLNDPSRKIITLEDPVEYSLKGLVQIPIKTMANKSFSDGLRAVLRMDPDVIMVGEIRDKDTALTALQAALSGHLVLSTFHAEDAAAALARLLTFTKGNPMFASALKMIISQRLVRKLDDSTKQAYQAEDHIVDNLNQVLGGDLAHGQVELYKAVPTDNSPFGYSGRTAVVEILSMSDEIERALHQGADLVAEDVRAITKKAGMKDLLSSALNKVLAGETTIEEVYRVI